MPDPVSCGVTSLDVRGLEVPSFSLFLRIPRSYKMQRPYIVVEAWLVSRQNFLSLMLGHALIKIIR
ncbi:MAG: hypothetical protein ABEJ99_05705 [Candidatus Nanohaloarchaea archaeon]